MFYLFLHIRLIRCLLLVILRLQERVRVSKVFIGDLDTIAESRKDDDVTSVLVLDNLGPFLRGIHIARKRDYIRGSSYGSPSNSYIASISASIASSAFLFAKKSAYLVLYSSSDIGTKVS